MAGPQIIKEIHPDGKWLTSKYKYLDVEIWIKSRPFDGMKAHCFKDGEVIFTQAFNYIDPKLLLKRMTDRVDMWKAGTWIPKKLREQ